VVVLGSAGPVDVPLVRVLRGAPWSPVATRPDGVTGPVLSPSPLSVLSATSALSALSASASAPVASSASPSWSSPVGSVVAATFADGTIPAQEVALTAERLSLRGAASAPPGLAVTAMSEAMMMNIRTEIRGSKVGVLSWYELIRRPPIHDERPCR
jgi:hypothetical protein